GVPKSLIPPGGHLEEEQGHRDGEVQTEERAEPMDGSGAQIESRPRRRGGHFEWSTARKALGTADLEPVTRILVNVIPALLRIAEPLLDRRNVTNAAAACSSGAWFRIVTV